MVWWMSQRGFKSSCRVCGAWNMQGYHFVQIDPGGPTGTQSNSCYKEKCTPSDNLEYLEWMAEQDDKKNTKAR